MTTSGTTDACYYLREGTALVTSGRTRDDAGREWLRGCRRSELEQRSATGGRVEWDGPATRTPARPAGVMVSRLLIHFDCPARHRAAYSWKNSASAMTVFLNSS